MSGAATLGAELAASRLLAPFFGTSLLIWANLIGVILIYLSVGYWLGGKWADRDPRPQTLYLIIGIAGFTIGVLPFVAAPVLLLAIPALAQLNAELGLLSFAGVLVLFAVPVTLLGCVTPFALRLAARTVNTIGATGGGLYSLSTIGSILGVYVTVFLMIPNIGTRRTFLTFSIALLVVAVTGLMQLRATRVSIPVTVLLLVIVALAALDRGGIIKAASNLKYETESQYNFIQVVEEDGARLLTVNEGQAYQSVYVPHTVRLGGYWDLFLVTPYLTSNEPPRSLLMVGLAGGTTAYQFAHVYPNAKMTGIEIDPKMVEVGRTWFDMNEPNLGVIIGDGRASLPPVQNKFDVIVLDAYQQPYIPFHLATVEYYRALAERLSPRGVIAINAARTPDDNRLAEALAATLRQVLPTVMFIEYPGGLNTVVAATAQPATVEAFRARLNALTDFDLREIGAIARQNTRVATASEPVFTDDRSSVETLIHSIIFDATIGAR